MKLYQQRCLPHILHRLLARPAILRQRQELIPRARGAVLEVGLGSGLNLPLYNPAQVHLIHALEPAAAMRALAAPQLAACPIEVRCSEQTCEEMPLADNSIDTVVLTYTLCAISHWEWALEEIRRVLKPGGKLLFCEPGQPPQTALRPLQRILNRLCAPLLGCCSLERPIPECLSRCGFRIEALRSGSALTTHVYWGIAS